MAESNYNKIAVGVPLHHIVDVCNFFTNIMVLPLRYCLDHIIWASLLFKVTLVAGCQNMCI